MPTYFDDVTTIENNRQVRVNIDATLVAIFRIESQLTHCKLYFIHLKITTKIQKVELRRSYSFIFCVKNLILLVLLKELLPRKY